MSKERRDMTGIMEGLSPKRANFVSEYCKDFNPRRAAKVTGYEADTGYQLRIDPDIAAAIDRVVLRRLDATDIDAEWVLMEAVDNAIIAKQSGNISASNTALNLVAKHVMVDAFAADKVLSVSDKDIVERLQRARKRLQGINPDEEEVSFF